MKNTGTPNSVVIRISCEGCINIPLYLALMSVEGQRHILIAGEMLELGRDAALLHAQCGEAAASADVDIVLGVRGNAIHIVEAAKQAGVEAIFVETPELAGAWLKRNLREKDVVLLKASRGVRLERALEAVEVP